MTGRIPKTWLRRNLWPLVALVVLVPGTIVLTTSSEWFDYQDGIYSRPVVIQPSQPGEYGGATFRVDKSVVVHGGTAEADGLELDPGLDLVAAIVEVKPGSEPVDSCTLFVGGTSAAHPGDRVWDANINLPPGFRDIDGTETFCFASEEGSFSLQVVATVPSGAVDRSAWVVIKVFGQSPNYLVLELAGEEVG